MTRTWMRWLGVTPLVCIAAIVIAVVLAVVLNDDPIMPSVPTHDDPSPRP